MDESASLLAPTTNLLPNSAIQEDLVEDHNLMGDEDASPSSTDLYDMINFDPECPENQTLNLEDLLNDPTSQSLESQVTPSDMQNASQEDLELKDFLNHYISQSLELEVPPIVSSSPSLKSEVHPSYPNFQFFGLEIHPSHLNSQSLAQSLELDVHPNHPNSQSLELQAHQDVSTYQSFPNQQHLHAQQYQIAPSSSHSHQFIQLPPPSNKRQKTSSEQCQLEYERAIIMENRNNVISHHPSTFDKIIHQGKPRTGCHCAKTKCSNRYCSCNKAGVGCSDLCQCKGCSNNYCTKNGGTSSTPNSSFSLRERALITTPSNNISLINERQLGGGFNTLTHNNLYGSYTNQHAVYGTPATNLFDPPPIVQIVSVAQPGVNPFAPSRNISQPQGVQMATTTWQQVNLYTTDQPQQQHMLMRLPPRFRQEVNDINRKHCSRE